MKITIPYSLELTVLGMCVVFLVLVFLMVVIYILSAVIRKSAPKPAVAVAAAGAADAGTPAVVPEQPPIETAAGSGTAPVSLISGASSYRPRTEPIKYRVTINGKVYDVETADLDAENIPDAPAAAPRVAG